MLSIGFVRARLFSQRLRLAMYIFGIKCRVSLVRLKLILAFMDWLALGKNEGVVLYARVRVAVARMTPADING